MGKTEIEKMVDGKSSGPKEQGKKVMVFSKSWCGYCRKAKAVFDKHRKDGTLKDSDYELMELDSEKDSEAILDYLKEKTGARSVPRVYINGEFIGGGDDVVRLEKSGELKKLLEA